MFITVYHYKIQGADFQAWQRVNREAGAIYLEYHPGHVTEAFVRNEGDAKIIMEIDRYDAKAAYDRIKAKTDQDPRIRRLYKDFETMVIGKVIYEEFECV